MPEVRKRKLIEVALPLKEISAASKADKDRKVGTIKNIHKWFAPMPTPALRALIFASLVDDPGDGPEREELLDLVKALVPTNGGSPRKAVLDEAERLIRFCNPDLPTVLDPFSGSGSTLVEAQRLRLPAIGSDLNPVAALISRAVAELIPAMAHVHALHPDEGRTTDVQYDSFIDDVRHYGRVVERAVEDRLGVAYPRPSSGTAVAWLWARTAPCANPACGLVVPLISSPVLSKQRGREASIEVVPADGRVRIVLHTGRGAPARGTKGKGRSNFDCPGCGTNISEKDYRQHGREGRLGLQLIALCLDVPREDRPGTDRAFIDAEDVEMPAYIPPPPDGISDLEIGANTRDFRTPLYGLTHQADLYTPRQLAMLAAFADEVARVPDLVRADGGSKDQARAIATVLGLAVGKLAQANSTLVRWFTREGPSKAVQAFGTQAMPMLSDFAECNPFGSSVGSWRGQIESIVGGFRTLPSKQAEARVVQGDARRSGDLVPPGTALLVTDPPYFGQINYADLSDYFYLWLRRAMRDIHPDLFATIAAPRTGELVANPVRHGGDESAARKYFIEGFTEVFTSLKQASRPDLPILVVYAHKQDEETIEGVISTGWESLLEAVLAADLGVFGTWPIEGTHSSRQISLGANALASYVIIICRPRDPSSSPTDRRGFIAELRETLPERLRVLQQINLPPFDLEQAALGPGMEVFSRYAYVAEPDGSKMSVRTAMGLISQALWDVLTQQEQDLDRDSRFALKWFEQYGWDSGPAGRADDLARPYGTSVNGLVRAGVLSARAGHARLLQPEELPAGYDPAGDDRPGVWEIMLHLLRAFEDRGIEAAADLMAKAKAVVDLDAVKELTYLAFSSCVDRKLPAEALRFNNLVTSWRDVDQAAHGAGSSGPSYTQDELPAPDDDEADEE